MLKFLLALILLPTFSFANIDFDNFYKENDYKLNSIAHCSGFLQGIVDIFDFLTNEYEEEMETRFTQEERDDFYSFFKELNHFNDITKDEMDFQLEMKCGKDIECRTEYANKVVEGFTQGFDNIFMLNEVHGDGLSEYAEEYLSDSDVLLDMCFDNANG